MKAIAFYVGHESNIDLLRGYASSNKKVDVRIRERGIEIETCLREEFPFFYLVNKSGTQIVFAHGMQDFESKIEARDENGCPVGSLEGVETLLRTDVSNILMPIKFIETNGGRVICPWENETRVERWYRVVLAKFLKRRMAVFAVRKFERIVLREPHRLAPYSKYNRIFVKSAQKGVLDSGVIKFDELFNVLLSLAIVSGYSDVIISEPLRLAADRRGKKEYRSYVMSGKVVNISRYIDRDSSYLIPPEIKGFVDAFVKAHLKLLPPNYVLDVGIDRDKGPLVIELNPISASGRYEMNKFEDIIAALRK